MSLPKPFYDADGITIYCGDNREIVPHLEVFDLLLTDPPYGIGRDGKRVSSSSHGGTKAYEFKGWDKTPPDLRQMSLAFQHGMDWIVWGGNYVAPMLPASRCWLVWDKGQRIDQADCELAFTNLDMPVRSVTINRVELMADGAVHPTQKPVNLMTWCLSHTPEAKTVLDPWMGSGTTLVAAKLRGLKAVGIEINEDYCKIAVERLRQGVLIAV